MQSVNNPVRAVLGVEIGARQTEPSDELKGIISLPCLDFKQICGNIFGKPQDIVGRMGDFGVRILDCEVNRLHRQGAEVAENGGSKASQQPSKKAYHGKR